MPRAIRAGDPAALEDLRMFHPDSISPSDAKLADAQLVLARRCHGAAGFLSSDSSARQRCG